MHFKNVKHAYQISSIFCPLIGHIFFCQKQQWGHGRAVQVKMAVNSRLYDKCRTGKIRSTERLLDPEGGGHASQNTQVSQHESVELLLNVLEGKPKDLSCEE